MTIAQKQRERRWITTGEAARLLGRTPQYVSAICRVDPEFGWRPHPQAHWRVDADVVDAVLAGRRTLPPASRARTAAPSP